MAPPKKQAVFTDSVSLYNPQESSVTFGFVNKSGSIKISPVFDEMKGKKPRSGQKMYDYDAAIFFSTALSELVWLKLNFDDLVSGAIAAKQFTHTFSEDIKVLTIGRNVLNMKENEEGSELFGILLEIFDRGEGKDSEPIKWQVFSFVPSEGEAIDIADTDGNVIEVTTNHFIFKEWIETAIRISLCEGLHNSLVARSWDRNREDREDRSYGNDDDSSSNRQRRDNPRRRSSGDDDLDNGGGNNSSRRGSSGGGRERTSTRGSSSGDDVPF